MNARESENYLAISRSSSATKSVEIFNRTVVPYEISKVNFRVETKIVVSMSEEI